jgi:hypothetical protein
MKTTLRLLVAATAASLAFAAPSASAAQGDTFVYNNSYAPIHPFFKFHCPEAGFPSGWVNFGGIGPQGFFGWGPLAPDGCEIEFTYTVFGAPAPTDPVKGTLKHKVTADSQGLNIFVIGGNAELRELAGPGETGR